MENVFVTFPGGRVTVAMKVLQSGRVAVARTYTMKGDKFSRTYGRDKAVGRLLGFYEQFRANRRKTRYVTLYHQGEVAREAHVLFEVVHPRQLKGKEKEFYETRVKPTLN